MRLIFDNPPWVVISQRQVTDVDDDDNNNNINNTNNNDDNYNNNDDDDDYDDDFIYESTAFSITTDWGHLK